MWVLKEDSMSSGLLCSPLKFTGGNLSVVSLEMTLGFSLQQHHLVSLTLAQHLLCTDRK